MASKILVPCPDWPEQSAGWLQVLRAVKCCSLEQNQKRDIRKTPFDFSRKWDYLGNEWIQQVYAIVARSETKMKAILAFLCSAWLQNLVTWQERSLKRALLTEAHSCFKLVTCLFICVFSDVNLLFLHLYLCWSVFIFCFQLQADLSLLARLRGSRGIPTQVLFAVCPREIILPNERALRQSHWHNAFYADWSRSFLETNWHTSASTLLLVSAIRQASNPFRVMLWTRTKDLHLKQWDSQLTLSEVFSDATGAKQTSISET